MTRRAVIITVGDELLSERVQDSNYTYIHGRLEEIGWSPSMHLIVGDDLHSIAIVVKAALEIGEAVIITGGLGPTSDDLTREGVAHALGKRLISDPEIEHWLRDRFAGYGLEMPPSNLRQAQVIEGAKVIPPTRGTAPGQELQVGETKIFIVPGVPAEMQEMVDDHVVPALREKGVSQVVRTALIKLFGTTEARAAEIVDEVCSGVERLRVAYLVRMGVIEIHLFLEGENGDEVERCLQSLIESLRLRLGPVIFSADDRSLQEVVGELLREKGYTLSVAESCTGGMLGEFITQVPGSSDYFCGGVIAYNVDVKKKILGVESELIESYGVVSEEVAKAMAMGVRSLLGSDLGLSVTGWAGPEGGTPECPVGTICIGLDGGEGQYALRRRLPGNRQMIRGIASNAALALLRAYLAGEMEWKN
jgi:nicotinamide-nucleotide amidase